MCVCVYSQLCVLCNVQYKVQPKRKSSGLEISIGEARRLADCCVCVCLHFNVNGVSIGVNGVSIGKKGH